MPPAKVTTFPGQQSLMGTEANKSELTYSDLCPHPGAGYGITAILWGSGQGNLGKLKSPRQVTGGGAWKQAKDV